MFLNGFQASAYAIEDRSPATTTRVVAIAMVAGIVASALFYCGIIVAGSMALPWQELVEADLPAVKAFAALTPSGIFGPIVLIAATISLAKAYNGIASMAGRLVHAQSELGFLPPAFGKLHERRRSPIYAIAFVFAINLLGVFLGRGAVMSIVNMCSICLAMSFVVCLIILLRQRRRQGDVPAFTVPGGNTTIVVGLVGALTMAAVAFWEPATRASAGIPIEWILIAAWALAALPLWLHMRRRDRMAAVASA